MNLLKSTSLLSKSFRLHFLFLRSLLQYTFALTLMGMLSLGLGQASVFVVTTTADNETVDNENVKIK